MKPIFASLASLLWLFSFCIILIAFTSASSEADDGLSLILTTSDPSQVLSETNAYVLQQLQQTPSSEPLILRVDRITDVLVQHARDTISDDAQKVAFVAAGLGFTDLWQAVLIENSMISENNAVHRFVAALLGLLPDDATPPVDLVDSREAALLAQETRNLTQEMIDYFALVDTLVNDDVGNDDDVRDTIDVSPWYQLSYGYRDATNARTIGISTAPHGRCFIWLNLGARNMVQHGTFASAVVHETWHCYQIRLELSSQQQSGSAGLTSTTTWQAALREGVVTYLTAVTQPDLSIEDLLFWSPEEVAAAEERRTQLISNFADIRTSTDPAVANAWLVLGLSPSAVTGAPSRAGYYLAYLAVQAYAEQLDDDLINTESKLIRHVLLESVKVSGQEAIWETFIAVVCGNSAVDDNNLPTKASLDDDSFSVLSSSKQAALRAWPRMMMVGWLWSLTSSMLC